MPHNNHSHSSYSPSQSDFCSASNNKYEFERNGYATDSELAQYHMNSGRSLDNNHGRSFLSNTGFRYPNSARLTRNQSINGSKGEMSPGSTTQNNLKSDEFDCMTPPLKLQSIQMLMNRLNAEENGDKNGMELHPLYNTQLNSTSSEIDFKGKIFRFTKICGNFLETRNSYSDLSSLVKQNTFTLTSQNAPPEPPPASADSGHPCSSGSNYDIREYPSLFSDAFKLDLSN